MFASTPNYEEFWGEWDRSKKLECLRFLNEIVCEFDKTVASTYLAAAALDEYELIDTCVYHSNIYQQNFVIDSKAADEEFIDANEEELSKPDYIVSKLCFPAVLINPNSELNCGPLIADVLGGQKPQYDIWGDMVNLASRMVTYGESGKIHMTKAVRQLLQQSSFPVTSRGFMKIKGVAEPIETFFLEFKNTEVLAQNCTKLSFLNYV